MSFFGIFVTIVLGMRASRESLPNHDFRREYLKQAGLLTMHMQESVSREDPINPHGLLQQFGVAQYILKNIRWVDWKMVSISKEEFY